MKTKRKTTVVGLRLAAASCALGAVLVLSAGCAAMPMAVKADAGRKFGGEEYKTVVGAGGARSIAFGQPIGGFGGYGGGFGSLPAERAKAAGRRGGRPVATPLLTPPPHALEPTAPGGAEPESARQPVDLSAEKRLVIYTANFAILVSNVEESMKRLLEKVEAWDGYMQTADLKSVTFRVPAARFDQAVEELSQMGVVVSKQIRAEDVTSQFKDVQLRLEVAETSRKRLLAVLEKAEKAEDILKIENEIRRLTEEIESMKAQLRSLADRIVYSTITVELSAKAPQVRRPRPRQGSYFSWINRIGAENVSRYF